MKRRRDCTEQSGSRVGQVNRHLRRSYDADFKIMVVNAAEASNNCQAAKKYGVTECNVRRWRVQKDRLRNSNSKRKAYRGPQSGRFQEIDMRVCEFVIEKQNKGMPITRAAIQLKALDIAKELDIPTTEFKASIGWCNRMMHRSGLALRRSRTSLAQHLPSGFGEKLQSFQCHVIDLRKKHSYPLDQIGIADQTPVFFDVPTPVTVHKKGVKSTGNEKSPVTVMLACLADGTKLPPYVILNRKTAPKEAMPAGIVVRAQENCWMESELVVDWLKVVWGTRSGALRKKRNMLVMDASRGHLTDAVKTQVRKMNGDLVIMPEGMTSQLQVLDVVVNKPFEDNLRKRYTEWLLSSDHALTPSGNNQKPAVCQLCEWILQAWDEVTPESIISGFKKCCISNALDGGKDDVLLEETGPQNESDSERSEAEDVCVQQLLVIKEEDSSEWSPSMDQKNPEPRHIKEEEEELWTSQDGGQVHGVEEADITRFVFTAVTVKSEDDEEKPQTSQLHQSLTENNREAEPPTSSSETQIKTETDGEDCGGSEPAKNRDPDSHPQLNTNKKAVDGSETDVSSDDWQEPLSDSGSETEETGNGWEETRAPESEVNALKYNEPPANETGCHTGKKSLSCFESSKGFYYKGSFQKHTGHLEKTSSDCLEEDECFGVTRTDDSLTRVNEGLKPYSCDVCGKRFTFLGNVQSHMRVHTGEKPFGCDDCGKRFSQKTNLKAHMRVHTGDKPFGCDHCSVRFKFQTNRAKHMRVHTEEKPFGCADCGKRFRQKTMLKTHMRVHTGEKPFGCEVCSKRFTHQGNLSKHMKLH